MTRDLWSLFEEREDEPCRHHGTGRRSVALANGGSILICTACLSILGRRTVEVVAYL